MRTSSSCSAVSSVSCAIFILFFAACTNQQSSLVSSTTPSEHPVLLIPGIAGSVLQSGSGDARQIVWVAGFSFNIKFDSYQPAANETCTQSFSVFGVMFKLCYAYSGGDQNFRQYLLGRYDEKSGTIIPAFQTSVGKISPLQDDLCAFSTTDAIAPNQLCGIAYLATATGSGLGQVFSEYLFTYLNGRLGAGVDYYGPMIDQIRDSYGFVPGQNLFGFPYDWRLSNIDNAARLSLRIDDICTKTGKKINIVAHSMGNLLTMAFLANHNEVAQRCVENWVAVGAPFQGAGGNIYQGMIEGYNFGDALVCRCTSRPTSAQAPSIFELMPAPNYPPEGGLENPIPFVKYHSPTGVVTLDKPTDFTQFLREGYVNYAFCNEGVKQAFPLNEDSVKQARKLRDSVIPALGNLVMPRVFIAYGTNTQTVHGVEYINPINDPRELIANCGPDNCGQNECSWPLCNAENNPATAKCAKTITYVDGDGTVTTTSSSTPPFDPSYVVDKMSAPGVDHVGLIKSDQVREKIFTQWLGYKKL